MKPYIIILILMFSAFIPEVVYIFRLFAKNSRVVDLPRITLRANAVIFLIGFFLLAVVILFDVNYIWYKAPMEYSKWKEIEWSDFRAIKRPRQTLNGSQNFAYICSEINYAMDDDVIEIKSLFYPSRSYTFNEEAAGGDLLQHELYHFHITEYYSRLIRKELTTFNKTTKESKILDVVKKYKYREREMQYQYDDESYHGYILGEQKKWIDKIDSSLSSLETFSKPIVNL